MSHPVARLNASLSGRYRVESQLGEGGMATVYVADDLGHEGTQPVWGPNGLLYARVSGGAARMNLTGGGGFERVSELAEGETYHWIADVLPRGDAALIEVGTSAFVGNRSEIRRLNLKTGETQPLTRGQQPRYTPSGHLLFISGGTLMATPFDPRAVSLTGAAVPMVEGVRAYSVANNGTLFYTTGSAGGSARAQMVWVTRSGEVTAVDSTWIFDRPGTATGYPYAFSLSPDGRSLAHAEGTVYDMDIWVKRLDRGSRVVISRDAANDRRPVWTPRAATVTFISNRGGTDGIWTAAADGSGSATRIYSEPTLGVGEAVWNPDGNWLVLRGGSFGGGRDLYALRPAVDSARTPLLANPQHDELEPDFSPDGRWLAYESNETGLYQIYVRPFPNVDSASVSVSIRGGRSPKWSSDGRELFFLDANDVLFAAGVTTEPTLAFGEPEPLFALPGDIDVADFALEYDVAPDGRFIMVRLVDPGEPETRSESFLVENFFEELRRQVPN